MFAATDEQDIGYLLRSIKDGSAVLVLGAGASASSKNRSGKPVATGKMLAAILSDKSSLEYNGESLTEVLSAVQPILGDTGINSILEHQYRGVIPSKELSDLFKFTWKRLYTWNFDDSIDNMHVYRAQSQSTYNGLIDKAADSTDPSRLQVVYLHGQISKLEHGLILTEVDYAKAIKGERHYWYQKAAQDYLAFCPIFVGTELSEPILSAELERAKRDGAHSGRAFLVTPDQLSPIRQASLRARGIVHLQGTLADLSQWLLSELPGGLSPKEILQEANHYSTDAIANLRPKDLEAARALQLINPNDKRAAVRRLPYAHKAQLARRFLQGFPPSWLIASSDIPVELDALKGLEDTVRRAIENRAELVVTLGQSGSGKSTATMMALLRVASSMPDIALYDLNPETRSIKDAFSILGRLDDRRKIIHVGDLFLYGEGFRSDLESLFGQNVLVVGTARSGEWKEYLSLYLQDITVPHVFQRFVQKDFDPLIKRLIEYVPAPKFKKMETDERHRRFASSKSQLLIALQEVTESTNFSDTISSEFENLPDEDTKMLMVIVGIATISRLGITDAIAREAYSHCAKIRSYEAAMGGPFWYRIW